MEIDGTVFTKVDVATTSFIKKMCQTIGVVDQYGSIIGKLENGKIVVHYTEYGLEKEMVLYDQPFDVNYTATLMNLYEQTKRYEELPEEVQDKTNGVFGDYRTAYKLELVRRY